ncbi:hypothetical protein ACFLQ6_04960 [Thermoproteota archaeon]
MIKVKSEEETERNYVEDSYRRAYLKGIQSLKWMIGIIGSTSLRGSELLAVLDTIDENYSFDESSKKRANELREELKKVGF